MKTLLPCELSPQSPSLSFIRQFYVKQELCGLRRMETVIQIDEARIRGHLGEMVQGTVEEALNAMLDAEADRLCGAARYERSDARQDTRAGYYERSLDTKAGPVSLRIPKPDIRHRDHRALPAARGFSRRSLD